MSKVITNPFEAIVHLKEFVFDVIAFDTETSARTFPERWAHGGSYEEGNPTGISLYNGVQRGVYIDTCGWTDEEAKLLFDFLGPKLSKSKRLIGHNIIYDLSVLYKYGFLLDQVDLFDTMTAAHLIDEDRKTKGGLGLKNLAELELGKTEIYSWEETRFDKEMFQTYALNDAIWTYELAVHYIPELEVQGLSKLFREIEMPFKRVLLQMEIEGVFIDQPRANQIIDKSQRVLKEYISEMYTLVGVEHELFEKGGVWAIELADKEQKINFNSNQQVTPILLDRGIELTEMTPTGNYSLKTEYLEEFKDDEFVDVFLKYKALRHVMSHFVNKLPTLIDSDDRMRPNWKNEGTVTGRLSSSSPNFQNLPNPRNDPVGVRDCVAAPPGKILVGVDYSGQETCVLAHVSKDEKLLHLLNNGYDLHLAMANEFMNLGISDEELLKTHPDYDAIKDKYAAERSKAKTITFGLAYGKSAFGFAKDFDVSEEEGQKILDDYFTRFPKVKQAIDKAQRDAERLGYVTQHFGRRRRFPANKWGRRDARALRQAFNFLIQSPSADMIRLASTLFYQEALRHPEWDAKLIMSVHDEIILEIEENSLEAVSESVVRCFIKAAESFDVKFDADVSWGETYAGCK